MSRLIAVLLLGVGTAPVTGQDTTVVQSTGAGAWRNPRLVEELRIGTLDGDERYIFGRVSHVEVTSDGSHWIVDGQGPRVRIYDRDGRYVRDVYRTGAGPGEINGVMGISRTPAGQVAIWDLPNHRVSLYTPTGEYASAFTSNSGWWGGESFQVDTAGRHWVFTSIRNPACINRVTGPDGTVREIGSEGPGCGRSAYLRYSAAGVLLDTAFIPVPETVERTPSFVVMLPEGYAQPFIPEWDYGLSPHGYFVIAHSTRYAINVVREVPGNAGMFRVTRVEREYDPVRLTRGEKNEWQARADYYTRRGGASAGVQIPDVKPALRSVSIDSDGRIWVDRYVEAVRRTDIAASPAGRDRPPPLTWREPRTFDVFEPTGRFLGTVVAPPGTQFLLQRGNRIWAVQRGEFDENYVVRYRLETS